MYFPIFPDDQIFTFITQTMVPNIDIGRYLIGSYGMVLDTWNGNRQLSISSDTVGYMSVSLHLETSTHNKRCLLHRLVAMAFIPGDWSLQVNHIDGKKYNNYFKNLEWVTARDNLIHAIEIGLNYRGEDKCNAILTNSQVHDICKLLEGGYDYNFIVNELHLSDINNIHNILHDIKCGKSWVFISKNYNIPTYKIVNNRYLTPNQVHMVCEAIQNNPKIANKKLFELINLDVDTKEKYSKARHCIESIKSKKAYTDISSKYLI